MKRSYDLVLILRPDLPDEDDTQKKERIEKFVGDGVSVSEITPLGRKQLAYEIAKKREGVYWKTRLTSDRPIRVADLEKQLALGQDILRYLLTAKQ
ncbi:30S ribosomal protein S6 [Patescibacteria group bacterium]|nr:30S ribosomal protein S6 [Patescibacteria group bacterium]